MNHPFLQFDPNNEREALCIPKRDELWARRGQFGVPRWLDWEVMQELNQYDRLENMMSRPLINLVGCNRPVYLELTIEFFASYAYEKPVAARRPKFRHKERIAFRLCGKWHRWSVGRLGRRLGIYTREDMDDASVFTEQFTFPSDAARDEFWAANAVGDPYNPRMSKASRLRDPLVRVMHHVFSHTICGRMDSLGNCPTPDLIFLYALVEKAPINLATRMAEYFVKSSGRTPNSQIHGGQYVTELAYNEHLMTDEVLQSLTLITEGVHVDIRSLKAMGVIVETDHGDRLRGLNNEVWDPLPPLPAEEEEEDVEMHEQHQPHTPPHQPQHHEFYQHQDWPEFYQQLQQMRVTQEQHGTYIDQIRTSQDQIRVSQDQLRTSQDQLRQSQESLYQGVSAGFSYLFGEMRHAYPNYFQNPPEFPPWNPPGYGGAGPSFTRHDDDDDE
ncbi:hypothetical protein HanIR_Chr01g0038991 [Helianthus annuus]|nr:hypothetical protein HanIR_Chr01g0038991 [Helianthus annuus]